MTNDKQSLWDEWNAAKERIETLESQLKTELVRERVLAHKIFNAINELGGVVLSRRQAEVMKLMRSKPGGLTNKELAEQMNIAERTVKFHISDLLRIYGVHTRHELMLRIALPADEDKTL